MDSYKKYQSAKQATKEASNWVANKDKIDSQDHKHYTLSKVTVSAEFCGQASAGAPNYHKSPDVFNDALAAVIKSRFPELSAAAIASIERAEQTALIACKSDIQAIQAEISSAEASAA